MLKVDAELHVLSEVGWNVHQDGDEMCGEGPVSAHLHVPGSAHLRVSMLTCWADLLMGLLAVRVWRPRVPTTLALEVQLYRPPPGAGLVHGCARAAKDGRSVLRFMVKFSDGSGQVFAEGAGSFMAVGDPAVLLLEEVSLSPTPQPPSLTCSIAERAAACGERRAWWRCRVAKTG